MLVAQQKLKENIAEYILYMYQIEDIVRAYNFDLEEIIEHYVKPQLPDDSFLSSYRKWYADIISQMKSQKIEKTGHLFDLKDIMVEISYLHNSILNVVNEEKYKAVYERAVPYIEEFKNKSNLKDKNHVEIIFHALYMKLLLKLKKQEISAETEEAFDTMRVMAAYLSRSYHQMKSGSMDFMNN
ncbi:MAG: DUF4924 family protein [Flavobacteriia bacterium]|nr:DUF4924 family protein [Flavobacteriia bacterium]